jgi:hypothetical protein
MGGLVKYFSKYMGDRGPNMVRAFEHMESAIQLPVWLFAIKNCEPTLEFVVSLILLHKS